MFRVVRCSLAAAVLFALAPASAGAESIFYIKGGDVYAAKPDAGGAVRLTTDARNSWPTQADNGTFAFADTVDGKIYRAGADGNAINSMTTYGTYGGGNDTVRLSPDGTKIAYRELNGGDYHVYWTPADATNTNGVASQGVGQESYGSPSWIGNTDLFLSHNGATVSTTQAAFALYHVGDPANTLSDGGTEADTNWQNAYSSAISRDGARVAAIEADTGDGSGIQTKLHLFARTAPATLTLKCDVALPNFNIFGSSPSFSPDGTRLAFAEPDGVHVMTLGDLSTCPAAPLVIPGATQPFWGAANPPVIQQGGSGTSTADTTAPVVQLALATSVRLAAALSKGLAFKVGCNEPCSAALALTLDAKTAKKVGLLGKKSKAKSVKVASGALAAGQGQRALTAKFTSAAKKKLKTAKKVTLSGTLVAADAAGNKATQPVKVPLKN